MNLSLKNPKIANEHIELYFTADAQHINDLIESEPCVLTVKGPRGALATAEIDNAVLLAQVCYLNELKFYSGFFLYSNFTQTCRLNQICFFFFKLVFKFMN